MKTINKLPAIILLALSFAACTEKIELDLGSTYTRLVVEGAISTDTMAHIVRLTKTTDFFFDQPPPAVSGAVVSISDGDQTFLLTEDQQQKGVYRTAADVFGLVGKTYTLNVTLPEAINGHSDYSSYCMLSPVTTLDSIGVIYREQWKIWEVQCWAWDPPAVNFYMFNIYKNRVLMTDTIHKIFVTDDRLYNGNYTNGAGVGWLRKDYPRENVNTGDTLVLQIAGITREYLEFVWAVQLESGYKNPLISGPPANIPGNITHGAMGFFAAYDVKYASMIVK